MTIEAAITKHLTEAAGLAGVLGGRVYPKHLPQNPTYPAIAYHRISGPREHSHDGSSGLAHPRFQLDLFARTHVAAKDLAEKVRLALDGYKGVMGGVGGVDVNGAFLEDDDDGYDDDLKVYWWRMDFTVWHNEING